MCFESPRSYLLHSLAKKKKRAHYVTFLAYTQLRILARNDAQSIFTLKCQWVSAKMVPKCDMVVKKPISSSLIYFYTFYLLENMTNRFPHIPDFAWISHALPLKIDLSCN